MCPLDLAPLKITISGDYWDCQIYMGRLYLWTFDGRLLIYKWDQFIDSIIESVDLKLRLPLECAFKRGDYLYDPQFSLLFQDSEFRELLLRKFKRLSDKEIEFDESDLLPFLYGQQDNPFGMLAVDSDIYRSNIYAVTDEGLWRSTAHRTNKKFPVSSRPQKLWDCPLLSLKASNGGRLALSGGYEGLFEYDISNEVEYNTPLQSIDNNSKLFRLSEKHSTFANWSFSSVYSSSDLENESYMAAFGWENPSEESINNISFLENYSPFGRGRQRSKALSFKGVYEEREIFNTTGGNLSWGSNEKIYRVVNNGLEVVRFTQKFLNIEEDANPFSEKKHIEFLPWKGEIVSGGSAHFGTIVECEYCLVVIQSDSVPYNIPGSVTRWRTYPRSKRYENHLHVILDDRIEILSFCNDYFVNQQEKDFGISFNQRIKTI